MKQVNRYYRHERERERNNFMKEENSVISCFICSILGRKIQFSQLGKVSELAADEKMAKKECGLDEMS
jgi:hypothetical protein